MLDKFRKATQTIYAKILIIVIIASFVFWGIGGMIRSSDTDFAIKVGDFKVSPQMYNSEVAKTQGFYRNYYGDSLTDEMMANIPFGEITSSRLVKHYLLLQEAKNLNITITDDAIFAEIFANPNYMTDDKFDKIKFNEFLTKNGISEAFYINYIKEYTSVNLIQTLFQGYNKNYDSITDLVSHFYNQEKIVDIYKVSIANTLDMEFPISEAELIEYHDKNSNNFVKAESRAVQYLDFSCKNLEQFVTLTDSEIQNEYQDRDSEYGIAELRDIKQLFFTDEESANNAIADIANGVLLADLATKYNIDDAVINIGEVSKDQVIGDFATAIFSADQGQFSTIVKGPIGYHVFYINSITEAQKQPLSVVKSQIVEDLTKQKSCALAYEMFNAAEEEIAAGSSLEEIAYNNQLMVQSDETLAKDGELFGTIAQNYPELSSEVLSELFIPVEPVKNINKVIGDDILIIYNIDKIVAERTKTLDEVKGIVTNIIKSEKQKQALAKLAHNTHKSLIKKDAIDANSAQFQLIQDQKINRSSSEYSIDVIEPVLAANIGDIIMPIYDIRTESYLVISVKDKEMMPVDKFEMQQIAQEVNKDLNNTINNSLFTSYLAYLRGKTEVIMNVNP
ncbi:MAG: hypothetical protein HOM96_03050 [Rickettsiales bacterium]|jgi:peptidyl-prolyl cis-trans isomerase D|nr:hypothetical protein [Rickettsiales bacterium]